MQICKQKEGEKNAKMLRPIVQISPFCKQHFIERSSKKLLSAKGSYLPIINLILLINPLKKH